MGEAEREGPGEETSRAGSPCHDLVRLPGRTLEAAVDLRVRKGAYLPHWTCPGGIYAVTFRLADSLPAVVVEAWRREREEILHRAAHQNRPLTHFEIDALRELDQLRIEAHLDRGAGECLLREPGAAALVRDALAHFDGERHNLVVWCVMPNHVHAVVHPRGNQELEDILHSWKNYTANGINRLLGRSGTVWQAESYDHLIRDPDDFEHSVKYALQNPEAAGLTNWPWSGRGTGFQPVTDAVHKDKRPAVIRVTTKPVRLPFTAVVARASSP
jgi:REP element-mobilizing transposase RayT